MGQGTGLGLSMVHGIMRSMGGAATVESTPDKGAAFALYFPASEYREQSAITSVPPQSILSGGRRILHVDDEEALTFLANRALSRQGHKVSSFTDPVEALKAFRAHPQDYDVVVTDFSMPHLSGLDLARDMLRIRPDVPLLMTTGLIGSEDRKRALDAGIGEVLLKPVNMNTLCEAIERVCHAG